MGYTEDSSVVNHIDPEVDREAMIQHQVSNREIRLIKP